MFSPELCWIGFDVNLSGSFIQVSQKRGGGMDVLLGRREDATPLWVPAGFAAADG